jgi:hypothetical protein
MAWGPALTGASCGSRWQSRGEVVKSAARLSQEGHFLRVEARGERIYLEMPDPAALPAVRPELAIANALRVTAAFETSGDPFQQVTGNFDGAGLSFGPLQVNLKTGTLQELFARFAARNGPALQAWFGGLWPEWQAMLRLPSRARQIAWADALSRGWAQDRLRAGLEGGASGRRDGRRISTCRDPALRLRHLWPQADRRPLLVAWPQAHPYRQPALSGVAV